MDILKHGTSPKDDIPKKTFECTKCGCKFKAAKDEYYEDRENYWSSTSISCSPNVKFVCSCPDCHKIVVSSGDPCVIDVAFGDCLDTVPEGCVTINGATSITI